MSDVVLIEVEDGVAVLTLSRPDRLNAWTAEMERAYFGLLEECGERDDVRVIVVTGAGRGFCAGADMEELQSIGAGGLDAAAEGATCGRRRSRSRSRSRSSPRSTARWLGSASCRR
jgi:enoyl-CoA hydratase/carnithine racemase